VTYLICFVALALLLPVILMRLIFLAPTGLGCFFYYSNVFSDFFVKRFSLRRGLAEFSMFVSGLILFIICPGSFWIACIPAVSILLFLEVLLRAEERKILTSVYAQMDSQKVKSDSEQKGPKSTGRLPGPAAHPNLIFSLTGPFLERLPHYDLGDIACGRIIELEILVGNHSTVPCQIPIFFHISYDSGVSVEQLFENEIAPLGSGEVFSGKLRVMALSQGPGGSIRLFITGGHRATSLIVQYRSVFECKGSPIAKAAIVRYPGACRSAFAWRGDMDLYDTSTLQSIDGISHTLGLASRYRFPQTMYLSARLSLDIEEARQFSEYFGVDRGHEQIPDFISWLRENVKLRHRMTYPFQVDKPYAMELGNHMFLHYGTDCAAAPGNNWKLEAKMGDGNYEWLGSDHSSFAEQRDNALAARKLFEKHFGFTPKSWATPDSANDAFTPAAMEAAGCQVLSDSDSKHRHNVLLQPPPHHPKGTGAVELTKRYPGDPEDIYHLGMLVYWIHRAHRRGIPVIFMCHQHMRQFSGYSCTRFTEYLLRYVLTRFNGDLHINTVYGIGIYWNEVFSPKNRAVFIENKGPVLIVRNKGDVNLSNVPVDISYEGGQQATFLIDLPPESSFQIDSMGNIKKL